MKVFVEFKVLMTVLFSLVVLNAQAEPLADPDGKEADMSKPVQVYILLGQSNMLGFGKISTLQGIAAEKYPYLVDDAGNWTERKDVRNVRIMQSGAGAMKVFNNEWMSIKGKAIGPEIGIGHHIGNVTDAPVLILKSCIGNRSLGWDLLPPGSPQYEYEGKIQAGYGETEGGKPKAAGKWYAGIQYDGDVGNAKKVLEDLGKYYPGATKYEVAGFFWWQGDKDFRNNAHAAKYEENLVNLFNALRKDFNAPNAKFVCATLGQTKKGASGNLGKILEAQFAISNHSKYPDFKGYTATVYSNPLSKGGSSSGHYSGNPETYMNIGEGMGKAMADLIQVDQRKQNLVEKNNNIAAQTVPLTSVQKIKLFNLVKSTLVEMSAKGELKPVQVNISKTRAKIWLAKADSEGLLTFQVMNGQKQASFNFDDLKPNDHIVLSRLIAALRAESKEAQAMAGLCINLAGNKRLAATYFKKSDQGTLDSVITLLN